MELATAGGVAGVATLRYHEGRRRERDERSAVSHQGNDLVTNRLLDLLGRKAKFFHFYNIVKTA